MRLRAEYSKGITHRKSLPIDADDVIRAGGTFVTTSIDPADDIYITDDGRPSMMSDNDLRTRSEDNFGRAEPRKEPLFASQIKSDKQE